MSIPDSSVAPMVVDPRALGRPVHLLPQFAARFGADLGDFLRLGPNRRYGTQFEVTGTAMHALPEAEAPARWMVFGAGTGRIGLSIERTLVLRLLQCRYGLQETPTTESAGMPVTASEERLARKLGQQLVTALVHRVHDGLQPAGTQSDAAEAPETLSWLAESGLAAGRWRLEVRLAEPQNGVEGLLCFSLDEGFMGVLLGLLASDRPAHREADGTLPLASRLKVRLVARLLKQRMPLGDILALKVGDVLPVNLQETDVLVKESRLFTASVAEHKGRLWLTAFTDI